MIAITETELAEIQALEPYLKIPSIPRQLQTAIALYARGLSTRAAAIQAGFENDKEFSVFLTSTAGYKIMEFIKDKQRADCCVTLETVTNMFFAAHAKAATATEEINATREIGRLHGLYPDTRKASQTNVQVNVNGLPTEHELNPKKIKRMTSDQLFELANKARGPKPFGAKTLIDDQTPVTYDADLDL